jgi:hypothetical protein
MMFTKRRAQIVADDIGEALDFVVGLAQIGGALVDGRLEIEIVVAQRGFGVVARGGERRTRKIEMPASTIDEAGTATVTMPPAFWLRSALVRASTNSRSSPRASGSLGRRCAAWRRAACPHAGLGVASSIRCVRAVRWCCEVSIR